MIVVFRAAQQVERHEARDARQMAVARRPDLLEVGFGTRVRP